MVRRFAGAWLGCCVVALGGAASTRADQFESLDGPALVRTLKGPGVTPRPTLGLDDIGAMPRRLSDSRSALLLVETGAGNLARLLVAAELHKPPPGEGEPTPVLVVERLDTFDAGEPTRRLASRRDVVLFDGLPVDLDSGQVVPSGPKFGADLVFRAGGDGPPRLEPVGGCRIFTLSRALPPDDADAPPRPSPGRAILPGDFAGRYRLFANGQWSGTLDFRVAARGVVTGQFRSDLHGTAYPVTGQAVAAEPGKVRFAVALPRARQEFDGYLFGEGKGAIAGTVTLLDRTFGFFAVREGGQYAPESRDLGPLQPLDRDRPGRITVEPRADGSVVVEGKTFPLDKLAEALRPTADRAPEVTPWVRIVVGGDAKLASLAPVIEAVHAAGIATIRLEQTPGDAPPP